MPLAFIGFTIAGIIFGVYAFTFYSFTKNKLPGYLNGYASTYALLALAFLIWGVISLVGDQNLLQWSVLFGNALLLAATTLLAAVLLKSKNKATILAIGFLLSAVLVWLRMTYYPPMPSIVNGILVFNTQAPVAIMLGAIFALIWLPANLSVAKLVSSKIPMPEMSFLYSFIYVASTFSAVLFISSDTIPLILLSFTALTLCFAMLLMSNFVLRKYLN